MSEENNTEDTLTVGDFSLQREIETVSQKLRDIIQNTTTFDGALHALASTAVDCLIDLSFVQHGKVSMDSLTASIGVFEEVMLEHGKAKMDAAMALLAATAVDKEA